MAPAPQTKRQKAELLIEGGSPIACWLNPKEITVAKANTWKSEPKAGQSVPTATFGGGGARTLNLDVLFDQSVGQGQQVKQVVGQLFAAMEATIPDPRPRTQSGSTSGTTPAPTAGAGTNRNTKRPPTMTFNWGSLMEPFTGNCTQLSVKYLLFDTSGEPLRAQATIALQQAMPSGGKDKPTNPTTRGRVGLGEHQVKDGDSLPGLAWTYYGDATNWRPIAEANQLDDPTRLKRGRSLFIPRID